MKVFLLLLAPVLLVRAVVRAFAQVIGTCCCGDGFCIFCHSTNLSPDRYYTGTFDIGEPICPCYQYLLTLSGLTGALAVCNGDWLVTYQGWASADSTECQCTSGDVGSPIWQAAVPNSPYVVRWNYFYGFFHVSMGVCIVDTSTNAIVWQVSGGGAEVNFCSQFNPTCCDNPNWDYTINDGAGASARSRWYAADVGSCDCHTTHPLPLSLTLTIINSTSAHYPNGIYTIRSQDQFGNLFWGWTCLGAGCVAVTFYLDFFGITGVDPGCGRRFLHCEDPDNNDDVQSFAVAGCTCNPITANGHAVVGDGAFDWSVAP